MTDEIIEVLEQTLILLCCVQTAFVYYIGLSPRYEGRILTWLKCSLSIYLSNFILRMWIAVSLAATFYLNDSKQYIDILGDTVFSGVFFHHRLMFQNFCG